MFALAPADRWVKGPLPPVDGGKGPFTPNVCSSHAPSQPSGHSCHGRTGRPGRDTDADADTDAD
jgi:hypothetical protein